MIRGYYDVLSYQGSELRFLRIFLSPNTEAIRVFYLNTQMINAPACDVFSRIYSRANTSADSRILGTCVRI
jgi:hypothetical protein